jgi:hypothetical protein
MPYLPLRVAENDCLGDGQGVVEITQGVKLPLFSFHSNKELLDSFQCQFIAEQRSKLKPTVVIFQRSHRLTKIRIGSVMNLLVISRIS